MATFISLVNFTEKGLHDYKASPQRADKFKESAKKAGATVKEIYWIMGAYDAVIIMEAVDDKTAAAVMLNLVSLGNVKTHTMRAFSASELKEIISKAAG